MSFEQWQRQADKSAASFHKGLLADEVGGAGSAEIGGPYSKSQRPHLSVASASWLVEPDADSNAQPASNDQTTELDRTSNRARLAR